MCIRDRYKNSVTHIVLNQLPGAKNKRSGRITGIETDPEGNIYVSTFGNGLFTFDPRLTLLEHYINNNGLTTPYIYTFVKDKHNTLWTLTENGLYYKEYQQENFTYVPNKQFIKHNYTFQGCLLYTSGKRNADTPGRRWPSTDGPSTIPATISPMTVGWPIF